MTGFGARVSIALGRSWMEARSLILSREGLARAVDPAAFVAASEIAPQFLGFLGCAVDEGVDGFAADGAQPTLGPDFGQISDLFR